MPTTPTLAAPNSALTALTAKPPAGEGAPFDTKAVAEAGFAAHFQRIVARQADLGTVPILPHRPAQCDDCACGDAPTALPSFSDTLGLSQRPGTADPLSQEAGISPGTMPEAAATILAAPFSPATSTANSAAAISADAPRSPVAAAPLPPFTPPTPAFATDAGPTSPPKPDAGIASSPGREFASQLTSAISAAHEPQSPGAIAAAVQQVVANFFPAHAAHDHQALSIATSVSAPGWAEEVGNRIAWIASQGRSQAELVLNPPQMGRIEVNLTLEGDQATASFASSNPVVRELLEAALPRLREVLADAGIQLGQAQVGAEHAQHQARHEKHGENPASDLNGMVSANAASSAVSSGSPSTLATLKSGRGLVDVFA